MCGKLCINIYGCTRVHKLCILGKMHFRKKRAIKCVHFGKAIFMESHFKMCTFMKCMLTKNKALQKCNFPKELTFGNRVIGQSEKLMYIGPYIIGPNV